jgi:hypothetical protein
MIESTRDSLSFTGYLRSGIPFDSSGLGANHAKIADIIIQKQCEIVSVLVIADPLSEDLKSNPIYNKQVYTIGPSVIEEEALALTHNLFLPSVQDITNVMKKNGLECRVDNFGRGAAAECHNSARRDEMISLMYQAYTKSLYPNVMQEKRHAFEHRWKKRTLLEVNHMWSKELLRLLSPCCLTESKRVYAMPDPFNNWDDKNQWQQTYIIGVAGKVAWVQGGSVSSAQREKHGKWAHVFATLALKGFEAPTYVYRYTDRNQFVLEKYYERFRVSDANLAGDYPAEWSSTKDLFFNRLLSITDNQVKEVKGVKTV